MGTCTALILVGKRHIYGGGISPSYVLSMWENDRIAWVLQSLYESGSKKVWVCRWEDLLNDALLMIALYVLKSENILNFFKKKELFEKEHIEIYSDLSKKDRKKLYSECLQIDWKGLKLTIIIFRTSSLFHVTLLQFLQGNQIQKDLLQLPSFQRNQIQLYKYRNMDFEICFPFYEKYWDTFEERYLSWNLQDEIDKINSDLCL